MLTVLINSRTFLKWKFSKKKTTTYMGPGLEQEKGTGDKNSYCDNTQKLLKPLK